MRTLLIVLCLVSSIPRIFCQEQPVIKQNSITANHLQSLLSLLNSHAYSFDLTSFNQKDVSITFYIEEFYEGNIVDKNSFPIGHNKVDLNKLSPAYAESLRKRLHLSPDSTTYTRLSEINIYLTPKNDSVDFVSFEAPEMAQVTKLLKKRPNKEGTQQGETASYRVSSFELDLGDFSKKEYPLLLYSAFWWDQKYNFYRNCQDKLTPDMSGEFLKNTSHYYILGVQVEEVNMKL